MIEGMKIEAFFFVSNSAETQSHYMLKLLAIESLIRRQCCTNPCGLYKALQIVRSLTGCTKPCRLIKALLAEPQAVLYCKTVTVVRLMSKEFIVSN
jgi:hypothetical protein